MTREVLLSLLRQGSTGNQVLQILDTIVAGIDADDDSLDSAEDDINF